MIEANKETLSSFLKNSVTAEVGTETGLVPQPPAVQPVVQAVTNTTDGLDKFTNLLESINKLLNSPLIKGVMEKGVDRKINQSQDLQAPEGYNKVNNTEKKPEPKINKTEIATNLIKFLDISLKEMVKTDENRTIFEIYKEFSQETVKNQLVKQIEVIL